MKRHSLSFSMLSAAAFAIIVIGAMSTQQSVASAAAQGSRRTLLDQDLRSRTIQLLSLSSGAIVYEDEMGRRRHATVAGVVALFPAPQEYGGAEDGASTAGDPDATPGYIRLADGQRFPGEHAPTGGDEDAVVWRHPAFGQLSFALDSVAEVVMNAAVVQRLGGLDRLDDDEAESADDELLLVNGDRLSGFLISLGDPVEIETDGAVVSVPPERVAAVRLASREKALRGLVVWLDDGTVAVVASVDGDARNGVSIQLPGGARAEEPLGSIRAVAFDTGKLRALASITPLEQKPVGHRALIRRVQIHGGGEQAVTLNAPDIELPGPMVVRWKLPPHVRRFGAVARMPVSAFPWGDCELVVRVDGVEALRQRLNQEAPRYEFSLSLQGASEAHELSITVEPGAYGPINDRVILHRALLMVDEPEG